MSEWKNFTNAELACKCGNCDMKMDPDFMDKIQELRDRCGFPFIVTSAARCKKHNENVGGSPNSYHMKGRAIDIIVLRARAYKLLKGAMELGFSGIGINLSPKAILPFIHLDDRKRDAMIPVVWSYKEKKHGM